MSKEERKKNHHQCLSLSSIARVAWIFFFFFGLGAKFLSLTFFWLGRGGEQAKTIKGNNYTPVIFLLSSAHANAFTPATATNSFLFGALKSAFVSTDPKKAYYKLLQN